MSVQLRQTDSGVVLPLRVQPKASRDAVVGLIGERLKVAVTAPPEKGKANAAVVKTVARALGLRTSDVALISGETSRDKELLISDCSRSEIAGRITALV